MTLDFPVSRFEGGHLPYSLNSLISLRKVVDFHFFQLFSFYKIKAHNFQAHLHIGAETKNPTKAKFKKVDNIKLM